LRCSAGGSHALPPPGRPDPAGRDAVSRAATLLAGEADGVARFRLISVGADTLVDGRAADPPTLFDRELDRPRRLEQAMDQIRDRLGEDSVRMGRDLPAGTKATRGRTSARSRKVTG
jgi:DNA polymerase-4